jgi:5'-deoxy-5'-methylthioadenosine phosphorylase
MSGTVVPRVAIIGGTGINVADLFSEYREIRCETRFGAPATGLALGYLGAREVLFLPRHGERQSVPPHRINYRANIQALKELEANSIIAFAAVGGISGSAVPGALVVPDQIIDYTYGRTQSFYDEPGEVQYVDFTSPYSERVRNALLSAAGAAGIPVVAGGVYGAMQGPRLESAAEIRRLLKDGCDIVGMTGMPEAALAREAGIDYATLAVVANKAAGLSAEPLTLEHMTATLRGAQAKAASIVRGAVERLGAGL